MPTSTEGTASPGRGGASAPSVLHLLAPAEFGGLESVVLALAEGQIAGGHAVNVGLLIDQGRDRHPLAESLEKAGIPVRILPVPPRGYARERREVEALIRELRPDVLHTHGYRPDVVDSGVGRRLGLATVTTVHGFTGYGWRGRLYETVQRWWFRRFHAVVAVSQPLARQLADAGVLEARLHVVRNGWAPPASFLERGAARGALRLAPEARVAGWVGRLSPEKGPEVALEALARPGLEGVELAFLGTGPLETQLRERSETLGVAQRIHWCGAVSGAGRHLPAFDAVLLTSWTEGTPMVLLEAMAAGVPLVATAVGGIPDVVGEGEAALVPPGDREGIARAVRRILEDPAGARARAEAARERLGRDFAVAPWVDRYAEVYRSAVALTRAT